MILVIKCSLESRDGVAQAVDFLTFDKKYSPQEKLVDPINFSLKKLSIGRFPQILLKSEDGAVSIQALKLGGMTYSSCRIINSDCNELWYVPGGLGICYTQFGELWFKGGDFIYVPCNTLYKFVAISLADMLLLGVESVSPFLRADFGPHAPTNVPFSLHAVVRPVSFPARFCDAPDYKNSWNVYVKRMRRWGGVIYNRSPFMQIFGGNEPFLMRSQDIHTSVVGGVMPLPTFVAKDESISVSNLEFWRQAYCELERVRYCDEFWFYGSKAVNFFPQGIWFGQEKYAPYQDARVLVSSRRPLVLCTAGENAETGGKQAI